MASWLARLFGAGHLPTELSRLADGPGVLVQAEGVTLKFSSRGLRVPGRYSSRGVRLHRGAVVVTGERIAMSIGKRVVLDSPYGTTSTPLSLQIAPDGVRLHLDVGAAVPDGKGTLEITARVATTAATGDGRYVAVSPVEAGWLARLA